MIRSRPLSWSSRFAAFLAVALLTYAGVASSVMQVRMAAQAADADCAMAGMPGMAMDHGAPAPAKAPAAPAKAELCAFCVDAAHAPLVADAEPLRPPSSAIFVVAAARPPLGARAPPVVQPRARGPPSSLQTA